MFEKKLDYAGLKKVAPSPLDLNECGAYPLEQMLGKVTFTGNNEMLAALQRSNASPHTVLTK